MCFSNGPFVKFTADDHLLPYRINDPAVIIGNGPYMLLHSFFRFAAVGSVHCVSARHIVLPMKLLVRSNANGRCGPLGRGTCSYTC
jgi:hypothetical protein